ncbi:interferon lambda-4-like, partial [Suricata suricatta]
MGPSGAAAVAVGLWVLATVGEAADPGVATPRRCLLSHYRSLDPRALAAVKEEETLNWRPRNCSFRPRRDPPRPW